MKSHISFFTIPTFALLGACANNSPAQDPSMTQTTSAETRKAQTRAPLDPSAPVNPGGGSAAGAGTDVYTNRMDRPVEIAPLPVSNDSAASGAVTGSSPGATQPTTSQNRATTNAMPSSSTWSGSKNAPAPSPTDPTPAPNGRKEPQAPRAPLQPNEGQR